ncbi:MAG: polysaccharide deacetylase family protein, partial [Saprospiraceae bacterium]
LVSHDVDHPLLWWKQTDRLRTLAGSILKRGNLKEARFWLQHLQKDPFDTFDWLMTHSEQAGLVSHFNFMGDRSSNSDCYYPLQHPFVQNLIGRIEARGHVIGFHPSYESLESPDKFQEELDSLQACVQQKINTGRQHYLRFQTPETWSRWDGAGMQWDSSMGYPEMAGFRCGVCYSFPVFDIVQRKTLQLWEKPLIAMEVSLGLYQHLSPETARVQLQQLRKTVKQYDGEFVFLWHNSSLNDYFWQSWQSVYLDLLHQP